MAFTIEEIEKALLDESDGYAGFKADPIEVKENPNYPIVVDYLTGKSNSLNGLQGDYFFYNNLRGIIKLLDKIDQPTANDQLVLDVINHPIINYHLKYFFNRWILQTISKYNSVSILNAAIATFKSQGLTNIEIFGQLAFGYSYLNPAESINAPIAETTLNSYLLDTIKNTSKLILFQNTHWSLLYFKLVEKARPEFATEYLHHGLCTTHNFPVLLFKDYQSGKYLKSITECLTNQQNPNISVLISKFRAAISLYESDKGLFSELLVQLSKQYLDYFRIHTPRVTWEDTFYPSDNNQNPPARLKYSACAFYFLFKYKREQAFQSLSEWMEENIFFNLDVLSIILSNVKGDEALPYFAYAIKTTVPAGGARYYQSVIDLMQKNLSTTQYLPIVWSLINHKSKPLKELVAKVIAEKDEEAETKAIQLLENKNAETRLMAANILSYFDSATATNAVMTVLNKEVNDNTRDILLQVVAHALPKENDIAFVNAMIESATKRGKLNSPIEPWLEESLLPPLCYLDGTQVRNEAIRFLIYRSARAKVISSDIEAKYIIRQIDKEKSTPFALALIKLFRDKETKPEHKYLMTLATQLGEDEIVDKIRTTTNSWIEDSRYKMAEYGVEALALNGSNKALRWVEWYSRKYRNKKANVGAAALKALESAAEELAITTHELGDRVVPDFGFEGVFKSFEVDGEEYRAFIDSKFKIAFFDEENKKLKAIPSVASTALKDEFKTIAKEIRDVVKSQSPRLEYYLIIQRRWTFEQWQQFFLNNPVMFIYATKLVWGIYAADGQLERTFICNDDTALINEESEEIEVSEDSNIGIVHPTQLSLELLKKWQKFLYSQSIEQAFPQLDRKIPDLSTIDTTKCIIHKYIDKQMAEGSITSTLIKYGWQRGAAGDGGMIDSFSLLHLEKNIVAVLEVEGVGAGYGWGNEEKLGRLYFIDRNKLSKRAMGYIKDDADERLVCISELPTIFFNEAIAAIEAIKPFEKK